MSRPVRFGIVGCGKVGGLHAGALGSVPDAAVLTAVCDTSAERAAAFAGRYGGRAFASVREMAASGLVDAVTICTPHPLHAEAVCAAAEHGVHALVEKPMAATLADCDLMLKAAREAGTKLSVISQDAFVWLDANPEMFDLIIIDFPDPSNYSLGKLYSSAFYRLLEKRLSARGLAVIQATSPFYARKSFWCIVATLEDAGLRTAPYHAYVPSFGEWGYIVAGRGEFALPKSFPVETRYLTPDTLKTMFDFPADMARVPVEVNRLNNQILVRYFEEEWHRVMR